MGEKGSLYYEDTIEAVIYNEKLNYSFSKEVTHPKNKGLLSLLLDFSFVFSYQSLVT